MAEFFHGRAERCELMACAVASNVQLQREHVIQRELIEAGVASTADARLRQKMSETFAAMLQGTGPSFSVLQGAPGAAPPPLAPLASLLVEGGEHIVLPEAAWAPHEGLLSCLTDIATGALAAPELPPLPSDDTLLPEMSQPMEQAQLQATFSVLQGAASAPHMGSVIRMLVQLAQLDGPLRMLGGQPSPCDLQTFQQHLSALANQLNTLHDPNFLGKELQSPVFARAKYELFALQHVQMLVWLQRVQQGLQQGAGKTTPAEVQQFVVQISHAARVLLFQPMLLHSVQVMSYVQSLPPYDAKTEAQPGSMRASMAYPPESATEQDRVEWLLLNLLLQFQTVYKDALCNPGIYTPTYSPGEASLFQGFFRLEEIYTHLIQRFPGVVVMSEQEMQVVTQLCQKINRHFTDGKTIRQCLETNPGSHGKQMLVQSLQLREIPSADYAVREWILPFMMTFTDLLKVLWTLWTQHAKRGAAEAEVRASCEGIARLVGERIVAQLADEELALRAAAASAPKDAAARFSRDFDAADRLREQLAKLGVTLDDQAKTWRAADGRSGSITQVNVSEIHAQKAAKSGAASLDDAEINRLVREREQARYTSDYKTADRLRDQLERHGVSLDVKEREGGEQGASGERVLPEKARRELAKHLRAVTSQSARQCEKALQANGDDIERAADWLISQAEAASKGSPAAAPEEAP
ncbi:hypothetical protein EMIHUDRAFT_450495 [Emiliania huxleyi CCMP1516]|uniref:Cysteinyl-tRNA ligase anticodon binding domain-containing protein n=2 Tax=Emiliania huxleyi TaxID=2903 RepID=A0A0D3JP20_EMIH1|nr:hypothetical protein EMIHUDRAFT_450495 [Emiliania huxleyi CCMP1516]EOD25255.1 hypothetical protein EMIHUDRAFT_450495 [Emiliania huxleyi CCMP1516]|eukprot:XP_005777684.1 hypothetical protein EMIHUDRAFT_450495 [Emiliania huxleyi CCMP1516]